MSTPTEITPQQAAEKIADGAQLIDVRRRDEWDAARLAGATHFPLEILTSKVGDIDKDRPIVFYCHSGSRSAMATEAFAASGYDAYNLAGGIKAWKASDLPVEPPGAEIVH